MPLIVASRRITPALNSIRSPGLTSLLGLAGRAVDLHPPAADRVDGERARLDQPRGPQPLVDPDGSLIHRPDIVPDPARACARCAVMKRLIALLVVRGRGARPRAPRSAQVQGEGLQGDVQVRRCRRRLRHRQVRQGAARRRQAQRQAQRPRPPARARSTTYTYRLQEGSLQGGRGRRDGRRRLEVQAAARPTARAWATRPPRSKTFTRTRACRTPSSSTAPAAAGRRSARSCTTKTGTARATASPAQAARQGRQAPRQGRHKPAASADEAHGKSDDAPARPRTSSAARARTRPVTPRTSSAARARTRPVTPRTSSAARASRSLAAGGERPAAGGRDGPCRPGPVARRRCRASAAARRGPSA